MTGRPESAAALPNSSARTCRCRMRTAPSPPAGGGAKIADPDGSPPPFSSTLRQSLVLSRVRCLSDAAATIWCKTLIMLGHGHVHCNDGRGRPPTDHVCSHTAPPSELLGKRLQGQGRDGPCRDCAVESISADNPQAIYIGITSRTEAQAGITHNSSCRSLWVTWAKRKWEASIEQGNNSKE